MLGFLATILTVCAAVPIALTPSADDDYLSGYILVNETANSNLFYWVVPAKEPQDTPAPIILWLQGGPGASGISDGLFQEHGPYQIQDGKMVDRKFTWTQDFHVIYVDNPVGTGYSYTDDDGGYVTNEDQMAENLFVFLQKFFTMYPQFQQSDFYVSGESYGGHFAPAICTRILDEQAKGTAGPIPKLLGMSLGNSLVDPIIQVSESPNQAYYFGLVDLAGRIILEQYANQSIDFVKQGDYGKALEARTAMESYITSSTGINLYDVRTFGNYDAQSKPVEDFLNQDDTKAMLHVGNRTFGTNPKVALSLANDKMKSVVGLLPRLMTELRVMFYQGQFDLRDGAASNEKWISLVDWPGAAAYASAKRKIWTYSGTKIGGWAKQAGNIIDVVVSNAGHMVPRDQQEAALDLIRRFIYSDPF